MTTRKQQATLLESADRTATPSDVDITFGGSQVSSPKTENLTNLHITVDVTAVTLTPSVQPKIFYVDTASGKEIDLITGVAALTSVSTTTYKIGRDIETSSGLAQRDIIPDQVKIRFTHADADSITYSVGVMAEFDVYQ